MTKTVFIFLCLFIITVIVVQLVSGESHVKKPDVSMSNITVELVKLEPPQQHEKRSKRKSPNGMQPDGIYMIEASDGRTDSFVLTIGILPLLDHIDVNGHAYVNKKTDYANQYWCTHLENKKDGIYILRLVMSAKHKYTNNYTLTIDRSNRYLEAKAYIGSTTKEQQFHIETIYKVGFYTIRPAVNKDLVLSWRHDSGANSVEFIKFDPKQDNIVWKIGEFRKEANWEI